MIFECPHCNKKIIEDNDRPGATGSDIVIKSRLVFLNDDGNILARCPECKEIVGLPLNFVKSSQTISPQEKKLIDL